ncbi:hypothetical protein FV223_11255 [Methylobacterium sp. WL116]|nr:hypothetical protein FV223_11255 [Methylobacterium sp. WL116]
MPIRREHRFFYPIDWPQLSAMIRFERAKGRCEVCARPHGQRVFHLGDIGVALKRATIRRFPQLIFSHLLAPPSVEA